MKNLIVLSFVLFAINGAMSQWVQQNSGTSGKLNCVFFLDADTGFAAGGEIGNGIILKTINGGETWEIYSLPEYGGISSIFFTDSRTGYAVGGGWGIIKTSDGGLTWNESYSSADTYFNSIHFTDYYHGFVAGVDESDDPPVSGIILNTRDGGISWTESEIWQPQNTIFFPGAEIGYSAGFGTIFKTNDNGSTWELILSLEPSGETFNSIYFVDDILGFSVTGDGSIYKTINGGSNWNCQSFNISLSAVDFRNPNTGYVVGNNGTILKSTDSGSNWINQASGTTQNLNALCFTDINTGYVVGDGGLILKTTNGGGLMGIESAVSSQQSSVIAYPNPTSRIVDFRLSMVDFRWVSLKIYDVHGREVAVVLDGRFLGDQVVRWDAGGLPAGVYYYQLRAKGMGQVGAAKIVKY